MVVDAPASVSRRNQGGRPPALITLDPSVGVAIGIDFGKRHLRSPSPISPRDAGRALGDELDGLRRRRALDARGRARRRGRSPRPASTATACSASGMGLPGPIHRSTGTVGSSAILPGLGRRRRRRRDERAPRPAGRTSTTTPTSARSPSCILGAGRGAPTLVYLKLATGHRRRPGARRPPVPRRGRHRRRDRPHPVDERRPDLPLRQPRLPGDVAARPALLEQLRATRGDRAHVDDVVELAAGATPAVGARSPTRAATSATRWPTCATCSTRSGSSSAASLERRRRASARPVARGAAAPGDPIGRRGRGGRPRRPRRPRRAAGRAGPRAARRSRAWWQEPLSEAATS